MSIGFEEVHRARHLVVNTDLFANQLRASREMVNFHLNHWVVFICKRSLLHKPSLLPLIGPGRQVVRELTVSVMDVLEHEVSKTDLCLITGHTEVVRQVGCLCPSLIWSQSVFECLSRRSVMSAESRAVLHNCRR